MYTVPSSTIVFVLIFNYDNEQNECVAFFVGNEIISYNFQQQQLFPPLLTIFASKKIFIWNRKWFQVKTILVKRKIIFLRLKKNKTNFRIYGYDNVMLTVNIYSTEISLLAMLARIERNWFFTGFILMYNN